MNFPKLVDAGTALYKSNHATVITETEMTDILLKFRKDKCLKNGLVPINVKKPSARTAIKYCHKLALLDQSVNIEATKDSKIEARLRKESSIRGMAS